LSRKQLATEETPCSADDNDVVRFRSRVISLLSSTSDAVTILGPTGDSDVNDDVRL